MSEKEIEVGKSATATSNKTEGSAAPKSGGEPSTVEHWWSTTDPGHMIAIEVDGKVEAVSFVDYAFECDLKTPRGKAISAQLHDCGREGKDIFVVGAFYPNHESGDRTEMMKSLRLMANEHDGVSKIKGLFTHKELVKAGIPPATDDVDALIMLALKTKSIAGRIENSKKKESAE